MMAFLISTRNPFVTTGRPSQIDSGSSIRPCGCRSERLFSWSEQTKNGRPFDDTRAGLRPPRLWTSGGGENFYFLLQPLSDALLFHFEVVVRLKIQPELRGHLEIPAEPQRGVGRDGPLALHDFIDTAGRHPNVQREPVLAQSKRLQEILLKNFAGRDVCEPLVLHNALQW